MDDILLSLKDLTKTFDRFTAVNTITLDVQKDEIFGFLGPNGAGKTTTIKMIAGLLKPTSGTITICGQDIEQRATECRTVTGYIPDRPLPLRKTDRRRIFKLHRKSLPAESEFIMPAESQGISVPFRSRIMAA